MSSTFIEKKISGIRRRIRCAGYGLLYFRNSDFRISEILKINGRKRRLKFKDAQDRSLIHEFTEICLNDCYQLNYLRKNLNEVKKIVDIGANQGLFIIVARQTFSKAQIICYEPNEQLKNILDHNANELEAMVYYEAVMKDNCKVELTFHESDLSTTTEMSFNGDVTGIAFQKVLEREGRISILKLDCEGAEWDLLKDVNSWTNIDSLTMEYHLWFKPAKSIEDIMSMLYKINFRVVSHRIITDEQGIIVAINRNNDRS